MLRIVESTKDSSSPAKSQTSVAYAQIRAGVLSGKFAPGERLKIADLAVALEVSPGAIREALSRLIPEQLVIQVDQKGFIAAPLSIEDLEDLTDLRCEIEAIALRRSVERADADWEATVLASAHRLRRTNLKLDTTSWIERHAAFHYALVSACGNRRLLDLHSLLYQQSNRYRSMTLYIDADRNVESEHQTLVDAALDRNINLLIQLTVEHFRKTTQLIVTSARSQTAGEQGISAE